MKFNNSMLMNSLKKSRSFKLVKSKIDDVMYSTINIFTIDCSVKNKELIAHFTHHKCGTTWFNNSLNKISKRFGLNYQYCDQENLESNTDIWLQWHSEVNFNKLRPYVGSHMIRDPRDITVSAYFYHLWCDEEWCNIPKKEYNNMSYKKYLNSLSQEQGILFEMKNNLEKGHTTGSVIEDISRWNYSNPRIIELKYEDVILNPEDWFVRIFKKYGFNEKETKKALKIVEKYSFKGRTGRKLGVEDKKSHMRKGTPGDWKNHFTEDHKDEFIKQYGDILIKLGYEKDKNW